MLARRWLKNHAKGGDERYVLAVEKFKPVGNVPPLWHAAGDSSATESAMPAASRLINVLVLLFVRGYATLRTSA